MPDQPRGSMESLGIHSEPCIEHIQFMVLESMLLDYIQHNPECMTLMVVLSLTLFRVTQNHVAKQYMSKSCLGVLYI